MFRSNKIVNILVFERKLSSFSRCYHTKNIGSIPSKVQPLQIFEKRTILFSTTLLTTRNFNFVNLNPYGTLEYKFHKEAPKKTLSTPNSNSPFKIVLYLIIIILIVTISSSLIYKEDILDYIKKEKNRIEQVSKRDSEKYYTVEVTEDNQVIVKISPESKYSDIRVVEFKTKTNFVVKCIRGVKFVLRSCIVGFIGSLLITSRLMTLYFPFLNSDYFQHKWEDGLVYCLKTGGACMIKLGQWAATRPDLFPIDLCRKLSNFHDAAPVHDFDHTSQIIRASFDKPLEEIFLQFDKTPIASGAIAQVYKAVDLDGKQVAVKVRHPNVEFIVAQDLFILHFFSVLISKLPGMKWMSLVEATDKFAESMREQLNLVTEASNLVRFQQNFEGFPKVTFPTPIFPLCSERVLVETFEKGEKVSEYIRPDKPSRINISPEFAKKLATVGFSTFLKMIFIDNLIHTDLHPGNILVREVNNEPEVVLLDAGLVTSLSEVDRRNFIDLFSSVAHKDCRKGAILMIERARNQDVPPTPEQVEMFKEEMDLFFTEITQMSLANIPIGPSFIRMVNICRNCHVKIEGNFSTMVGGLVVIEGLSRQLNADFDLMEESLPLLSQDKELRNAYLQSIISGKQKEDEVLKTGISMMKIYFQRGKDYLISLLP